jgi:hypothetical protein
MLSSFNPKARRRTPEADAQRAIVTFLRMILPRGAIVHHSANEVRGSGRDHKLAQGLAVGMGVHGGFSDLLVLSERRLLFLEVKSMTGRPTPAQRDFESDVVTQGHAYEIVRSVEDTRAALEKHKFTTRESRRKMPVTHEGLRPVSETDVRRRGDLP